jgi:hypothetical protein
MNIDYITRCSWSCLVLANIQIEHFPQNKFTYSKHGHLNNPASAYHSIAFAKLDRLK